jgi:hypothetical protein
MTSGSSAPEAIDPSQEGWVGFVNQTMVDVAHELGMGVKPWTAKYAFLSSISLVKSVEADEVAERTCWSTYWTLESME